MSNIAKRLGRGRLAPRLGQAGQGLSGDGEGHFQTQGDVVSGWHFLTKLRLWTRGLWRWQLHAFFHQLNLSTSWVQGPGRAAQELREGGQ